MTKWWNVSVKGGFWIGYGLDPGLLTLLKEVVKIPSEMCLKEVN